MAPGLLQGWLWGFVLTRAAPGCVSRLCPSGAEQALIHPQPLNHPGPAAAPFPKSNLGSDGSSWARPGEAGAGGSQGCGVRTDPAWTWGRYHQPPLPAARVVMVVQTQPTKQSRNPHGGGGSETTSPHPAVRRRPKGPQISCNLGETPSPVSTELGIEVLLLRGCQLTPLPPPWVHKCGSREHPNPVQIHP